MGKPGIKASVFSKRSYSFSSVTSCPFLNIVKRIFLYLLYSNEDYRSTLDSPLKVVYHSFEVVNTSPFCIGDPEQDLNDNHSKASEPLDTKLIYHLMYLILHLPRSQDDIGL
jgi:hypothetical protein